MPSCRSIVAVAMMLGSVFPANPAGAQDRDSEPRRARFVQIENLAGCAGFFNLGQGTVRILALMSPTCADCTAALEEIARIMNDIPSRRLRAYIIYVPTGKHDMLATALATSAILHDRRVSHFWDPGIAVGTALQSVTGTEAPVSNGCFLFDTNAVLRDPPTTPPSLEMYIHAHDDQPPFDGKRLEAHALALLEKFAAGQHPRGRNDE